MSGSSAHRASVVTKASRTSAFSAFRRSGRLMVRTPIRSWTSVRRTGWVVIRPSCAFERRPSFFSERGDPLERITSLETPNLMVEFHREHLLKRGRQAEGAGALSQSDRNGRLGCELL